MNDGEQSKMSLRRAESHSLIHLNALLQASNFAEIVSNLTLPHGRSSMRYPEDI